jgi:hypothetical protein
MLPFLCSTFFGGLDERELDDLHTRGLDDLHTRGLDEHNSHVVKRSDDAKDLHVVSSTEPSSINTSRKDTTIRCLILLDPCDFQQKDCWTSSRADRLQQLDVFPCKLEIVSKNSRLNKYKTVHKELRINHLYVRLPKERVYVSVYEFSKYYVYSQLSELKTLLLLLNTEIAKIKEYNENLYEKKGDDNELDHVLPVNALNRLHPGLGMFMKKLGSSSPSSHSCLEIRFPGPDELEDLNTHTKSIQYKHKPMHYHHLWKQIIENRVNRGANYEDYIFLFETPAYYKKFANVIQVLGGELLIEHERFQLQYEIYYYPTEMLTMFEVL